MRCPNCDAKPVKTKDHENNYWECGSWSSRDTSYECQTQECKKLTKEKRKPGVPITEGSGSGGVECPDDCKSPKSVSTYSLGEVINPAHYQGDIECIDALESIGIGIPYCRANAIKYLWRLGKKGPILEDAKKAQWYIDRLVKQLEK